MPVNHLCESVFICGCLPSGQSKPSLPVPLAGPQVHKLVKFRTTAMVVRGAAESLKPPINADERGCSPVPSASISVHRRFASRRYEAHSPFVACAYVFFTGSATLGAARETGTSRDRK